MMDIATGHGELAAEHDVERHDRVDAEARRERERQVREQAHRQRGDAAAIAVATATALNGMPAADRIAGLTNRM